MCLVYFQEEVLKIIEGTELFKHLNRWLASEICSCKSLVSLGFNENSVFPMKLSLLDQTCRKETNLTLAKADGAKPMTLVSGKTRTNGIDQGIDMLLVPSSLTSQSGNLLHPSTAGILTLLVLALPQRTWAGIKQEKLLAQFNHLTSIDNLPTPLQLEVINFFFFLNPFSIIHRCLILRDYILTQTYFRTTREGP